MKSDFSKLAAALLADPSFRGLADAIPVELDDAPTTRRTVRDVLHLDRITKTHRSRGSHRCELWTGAGNAATYLRRLPAPGQTLHAITDGSFTGCDIIPAILDLDKRATAAEVIITTLSFSQNNVDLLAAMMDDKRIRKLLLLASSYFRRTRGNAAVYDYATEELGRRGAAVLSARCHAKIILITTTTGHRYTVETSANLRSCLCIEHLAVTRDPRLYQFHRKWINHVRRLVP